MERVLVVIVVAVGVLLIGPIWWLGHAFMVTSSITVHQIVFWSALVLIPFIFAQIHWSKNIGWRIHWKTVIPLWGAFFFVYYTTGMFYFSGIADKSMINAQAMSGEWEESYTSIRTETVCDSTDKDGKCTSSHTVTHCDNHHSDDYTIGFSDGSSHSINSGNYKSLTGQFGNQKEVPITHFDQCSIGDGRKFVTEFQAGKSEELYVSYEIPVVNYILAGHNLYQTSSEVAKPYLADLQPVPGIVEHPSGIGAWKTNRVITSSVTIPDSWKTDTDKALNKLNGVLGPSKEVNAVLYVVGSQDRTFASALDAYWAHGKKNQLTIVVGSSAFPKIDWVDVLDFWSLNPEIRINLRDQLQSITLDDPRFMQIITSEVRNNWKRHQMKTFEYLAWDITMSWWSYPLIVLFAALAALFFSRAIKTSLESM